MITIAGVESLVDASSWSAVAQKTFALKKNSQIVYNYQSVQHLRFEMTLRGAIVDAAITLRHGGLRFADFKDARCNEQLWSLTSEGGFRIRQETTPAVGLRDIFADGGKYATECATASMLVVYKGVLDSIGDTHFNRLFSGLLLYDWHIDDDLRLTKRPGGEPYAGDLLYFNNPDFSPDTPQWRGENVVKIDDDLYYGHPIGILPAQTIIAFLNRFRRPGSQQSAYLIEEVLHPDFLYLSQFTSGLRSIIYARIGSQHTVH